MIQGTAFNWPNPDHFRIVFLPREDEDVPVRRDIKIVVRSTMVFPEQVRVFVDLD